MDSKRRKLGSMFSAPSRSQGLEDLLPVGDEAEQPAPTIADQVDGDMLSPQVEDGVTAGLDVAAAVATPAPVDEPVPQIPAEDAPAGKDDTAHRTQPLAVILDPPILADFRAFAARTGQTLGAVVLRAVDAGVDFLPTLWATPTPAADAGGSLFSGPPMVHRRSQPGMQVQFRVVGSDAAVLDRLVEQWGAPSRSALVNEALRRYLPSADGQQD